MKRVENSLDTKQVLKAVERYSQVLELLESYDYQNMEWSEENIGAIYQSFAGVKAFVKENKYCSDCDGYIYLAKLPIDLVLSVKKYFAYALKAGKKIDMVGI